MESLTGLSAKGVIIEKHRGGVSLSKYSESCCFLGLSCSKLSHVTLLTLQHKTIQPISCVDATQSSSHTQTNTQNEETETTDTNQSKPVRVKFQLHKDCSFGQHFLIVGDDPVLGSWDPSNAVPLDWSEGHVWNVELDIPSGKTISYKFIMKGDGETILWQQDPDRILQTWETKNTITVSEDWDNAELQIVVEEEPAAEQSETSIVNPELPTIDQENDANKETTVEVTAIVAENISELEEDANTDQSSKGAFDTTMEAKTIDSNNLAFKNDMLSSKEKSIFVAEEKVPVLVPGLSQVTDNVGIESSVGSENEVDEVQVNKAVAEVSVGSENEVDEVQVNKAVAEVSVGSKSEELSSKEELVMDFTETPKIMRNTKQELSANEDIGKSEAVDGGDWSNGKPMEESTLEIDLQWGKRTLQKLFAGLGFFKVELES